MANSAQFKKTPVRVQNVSGFDLSHTHLTTGQVGTLIPVMCQEVMPNSKLTLGALANVELPPFATDFNGKIDLRLESFFIPYRQLFAGFKGFISTQNPYTPEGSVAKSVPLYVISSARANVINSDQPTLENYLGCQGNADASGMSVGSALPMLAYHWVYQHYYRDSRVQSAPFVPTDVPSRPGLTDGTITHLPWLYNPAMVDMRFNCDSTFHDGYKLGQLRQRNYDRDYFTTAMLTSTVAQAFNLKVEVNGEDGEYSFTIPALRQINSLQRFVEVLGQIGNHYGDYIHAMYGRYPSSEVCERPIYLGSVRQRLYSAGIDQNNSVQNESTMTTWGEISSKNPYSETLGGSAGQVAGIGNGSLCDSFHTDEFGVVMVLASIVPVPSYSTGTERMFRHITQDDFANPMFANIGNQPVYAWEIDKSVPINNTSKIFGWVDRYAEYKYQRDRVSGSFRDNMSLSSFALKRGFIGGNTTLNSSFIMIRTDALRDVLTFYDDDNEQYNQARFNIGFEFKLSCPLPSYSIPSLEDVTDKHTVMVDRAGSHL